MKKIVQLALLMSIVGVSVTNAINAKNIGRGETYGSQNTARQISKASDEVQEAVKNVQMAPVAEKAMARQEANDAVENLLATLHERTWTGDLRGYTKEQIKEAGKKLELLNIEKNDLTKEITAQEAKVAEMTDARFWGLWSSAKKGKDAERNDAKTVLTNLRHRLTRINRAIHSEEVVAGKIYSLAIKRAAIIIGLATAAGITYAVDAYYFDSEGKAYLQYLFGIKPNQEAVDRLLYRLSNLEQKAQQLDSESLNNLKEQHLDVGKLLRTYGVERKNKHLDTLEKAVNEQLERQKIIREQLENESVSKKVIELVKAIRSNEKVSISKKATELEEAIRRKVSTTAQRAKEYFESKQ